MKKILLPLLALALVGCSLPSSGGNASEFNLTFTNMRGFALKNIEVKVGDQTLNTNSKGEVTLAAGTKGTITLGNLPAGYLSDTTFDVPTSGGEYTFQVPSALIDGKAGRGTVLKRGDVVYDWTLNDIDGNTVKLSEKMAGKKGAIVNFFFVDCGYCKEEFPYFTEKYPEISDDYYMVGLDDVGDSLARVKNLRETYELPYDLCLDNENITRSYGVTGYPTTIFIDEYGIMLGTVIGAFEGPDHFAGWADSLLSAE